MSTVRQTVEERAAIPQDPVAYFRPLVAGGTPDSSGATSWHPGLFRVRLRSGAFAPLEGLSELARVWRPHLEEHPAWNPGAELLALILASDLLTRRDKRQLEQLWALAAQLDARELARQARHALGRFAPRTPEEYARQSLLLEVAKDIRRVSAKPRRSIVASPADAPDMPRILDAVFAYFVAVVALDRLSQDRIEFMVRRLRGLQSVAGLVEGPADFAARHTEYSLPRRS